MSNLEIAYADGQWTALCKLGLAQPSLASAGISEPMKGLGQAAAKSAVKPPGPVSAPPTTPAALQKTQATQLQNQSFNAPVQKLSADLCTSCRKEKHYGPCLKPYKSRPAGDPIKRATFNPNMNGSEAPDPFRRATSGRYSQSVVSEEPGRAFGKSLPAINGTDTVGIDQLGVVPDGEPAVLG